MRTIQAGRTGKKATGIFLCTILFLLIFLSISSCNLFLSLPRGRENLNDPAAQITAFTAVPSGDKSIVTMWNWRDAPGWISSEERIDEIKIMHSITGYPDINFPFIGQKYDDNSTWQYEWDILIGGITHYFALYAKDNNGTWYAPLRAKAKLPGTAETGVKYNRVNSVNADSATAEWMPDNPLEIRESKWAVVYFDIPVGVYINKAIISLMQAGTALNVTFAPLNAPLPENNMEIYNSLNNGDVVNYSQSITFTTLAPIYDITDVVRAAAVYSEQAIIIKTSDPASTLDYDNNASLPYIIADIIK